MSPRPSSHPHRLRRRALALLAPALVALTVLGGSAGAAREPRQSAELYHGLILVDPVRETLTPDAWMLVADGRIVRLGHGPMPRVPASRRHDFTGHWVLPGLIDTHAHMALGPLAGEMKDGKPRIRMVPDSAITAHAARALLAHGVTTVRDPGGDTALTLAYARDAAAGRVLGPEALVAGTVIDRTDMPVLHLTESVSDARPADALVREQAALGVDFVKFYVGLTEADLAAGVAAARRGGVRTIAHLGDVSWTRAAELGLDGVVHMMPVSPDLLPPDRREAYRKTRRAGGFAWVEWYEQVDLGGPEIARMIEVLARRRVHVDPTLVAFEPAFLGDDPAMTDRDLALAHPALVADWKRFFRFDAGWSPEDHRRARAVWPKVLRLNRMLYEAGVPMTIGTDMNNPFVSPGISVSREMELQAASGIPRWGVLRMATSDAARILGIDRRTGRLRAGLEADAVFLTADPTRDLAALRSVAAVLHNGRLLRPAHLQVAR